ncbi:MAG: hypothetical protein RMJ56_17955 [Gemmataceae bacterium]|nr:hypothetical protein [Gemmata sp.]MDW8199480.1 hypothetical protein [Gemmataceae bacterium]
MPRWRSARQAVLWGLAAILLANVALAVAVETVWPQLRDPEYGYRIMRLRQLQQQWPQRPWILVIGSSRTQNAIDPQAMGLAEQPDRPWVFNFGIAGAGPVHQRLLLQKLLAQNIRPTAVLAELLPVTLATHHNVDPIFTLQVSRLSYDDVQRLEPYLAHPRELRRRWLKERLDTWSSQQPVLLSHIAPSWQAWAQRIDHQWEMLDDFGYTPYPEHHAAHKRAQRQEVARSEYADYLRDLHISELATRAIRDLVSEARAAGIPVAFFITPESPLFRSWYSPLTQERLHAYIDQLTHQLACPVFLPPTDFTEDDFADGHHILPAAAARYSRWLAQTHLQSWLQHHR